MSTSEQEQHLESDPRFPSGPWVGFFLDKRLPGRHGMDLRLTFQDGRMTGEGRDRVGTFVIDGTYHLDDGKAFFSKTYPASHTIRYQGYNEGKGIWGTWELDWPPERFTGGFHIWPKAMPDPSQPKLSEEAEVPQEIDDRESEKEPELVPMGGSATGV